MIVKTNRLSIKPYSQGDMETLIELLSNDTVKETFIVPDLQGYEQYEKMFTKMKLDSESEQHYAGGIYLDETLIGVILDTEITNTTVEVGYAIHPDYHNRGYASEALHGVIMYAFQRGIVEVTAGAFSDNLPSIKVMKKNGMKQIDRQDSIEYRGKMRHCVYYSIRKQNNGIQKLLMTRVVGCSAMPKNGSTDEYKK